MGAASWSFKSHVSMCQCVMQSCRETQTEREPVSPPHSRARAFRLRVFAQRLMGVMGVAPPAVCRVSSGLVTGMSNCVCVHCVLTSTIFVGYMYSSYLFSITIRYSALHANNGRERYQVLLKYPR